jgi:hypothetical protein
VKVQVIFKTDKRREAIEAVKMYKLKMAERDRRTLM